MSPSPGFIELPGRGKLLFEGPQALWFLDQLVSNKVVDLDAGLVMDAMLLTPNGRITAVLRILATEQGAAVDADPAQGRPLLDFFQMRIFATKVQISDASQELEIVRIVGDEAVRLAENALDISALAAGPGTAGAGATGVQFDGGVALGLSEPLNGVDLWIHRENKQDLLSKLQESGATALSEPEYDSLRVAAGVAMFGRDFDDTFLPQEAAMERAVHFEKGCYLGQEAVAMTQRGRVKRRLRHLEFKGKAVAGPITFEGEESGQVTSSTQPQSRPEGHSPDGDGFGIGPVKTNVALGAEVSVQGSDGAASVAVVQDLPGTTYGPHVPSARELRERLQG